MSKIIIQNKIADGIPLNEFYLEDETYKGLVFVQHGYRSNKERGGDSLAIKIAREKYFVVAIDAYMHGERKEGPYIKGEEKDRLYYVPSIIRKTALDIVKLHKTLYKNYQTFDMVGVSLGGMIAYSVVSKTGKVRKLVPVISTPKVENQANYVLRQNNINSKDFFDDKTLNYLKSCDPYNEAQEFRYESMFILNGNFDKVVSTQDSIDYYNEYKNEKMEMRLYDVAHDVSKDMMYDIVDFLNN